MTELPEFDESQLARLVKHVMTLRESLDRFPDLAATPQAAVELYTMLEQARESLEFYSLLPPAMAERVKDDYRTMSEITDWLEYAIQQSGLTLVTQWVCMSCTEGRCVTELARWPEEACPECGDTDDWLRADLWRNPED